MRAVVSVVVTAIFVLYPLAIYFGLTHLSARTLGLWMLAFAIPFAAYRLRKARRADLAAVATAPIVVLILIGLQILFDRPEFVLAMPALINLGLGGTFLFSFRSVPMIERFARLHEGKELNLAKKAHCAQATWAWVLFFFLNATTATLLALFAPLSVWAAYNGGVAYALMGLMFAGEYVLRQYRFREYGNLPHHQLLSRIWPPHESAAEIDEEVQT